ncbi:hypothetical protein DXG03_007483, partial [Asterophora parasitica]
FAFVYGTDPGYTMQIGMLFVRFIGTLIKESPAHGPNRTLRSASLYVCDYHRGFESRQFGNLQLKPVAAAVEAHVRDAEATAAAAGSTPRATDLDIKSFPSYDNLSFAFDLLDLKEPLRRFSRF